MSAPTVLGMIEAFAERAGIPRGSLQFPHPPPGLPTKPCLASDLGMMLVSLPVIASVPGFPMLMATLFYKAWKSEDKGHSRKLWGVLALVVLFYVLLAVMPVKRRPSFLQSRLWQWGLEYMSVRIANRSGKALPEGQYMFALFPHGLFPFTAGLVAVSDLAKVFMHVRIASAEVGFRLPVMRQALGWQGAIPATRRAISKALGEGDTVGLMPGGIAEMVKTRMDRETLVLKDRKGFVREALSRGVPIVPVYVFGQSITFGQLTLPSWVHDLSRKIRLSIMFPYGRWGMLIPRKLPLLFAIGDPIKGPSLGPGVLPTDEQVNEAHSAVVAAVSDLYDFYKGIYGWNDRPLTIE
eukprot:CAMPEP_0206468666 /NCGR_PEP_ID=MMETSP0324_2-20121206/29779_1 /ASSEMBLY_ACC=CAM_ASM_000836 /TAXON_ID=2866 /ORGANISM="Crypthecodinium cohnii, Strain Seligo" /LENGTH=351 /DNA_ID=CAMNT_0053942195 /DNA_START=51 /DNA_END=1107 /DNA_ORIENTATION=-